VLEMKQSRWQSRRGISSSSTKNRRGR